MFSKCKTAIQELNRYEKIILLSVLMIFVDPYALLVFCAGVIFWEIKEKRFFCEIQKQPGYKFLCAFMVLGFIFSILSKNLMGVVNMGGYFLLFGFVMFYRKHLTRRLLPLILEEVVLLSIVVNVIGLIQFAYLSNKYGHSFLEFKVLNSPKKRITYTWWNANFYAMINEFVIVCCMARFVQCKKVISKIFYVVIGLFNLMLIYLTGCRAAFMPFVILVPIFLFLTKENKWAVASIVCILLFAVGIYFFPRLIPRIDDVKTVNSRIEIWTCALNGLKTHPLFGQGPQAYGIIYPVYNGHPAPHAHNIYLDVLINFGVVGTGIIIAYITSVTKDAMKMLSWKEHPEYFAIALAFAIIALVHGIMDCTLNMPCTGLFFLLMVNMASAKEVVLENK
ncbi:MAG: O-antigen ligase family protein [Firmicutes bacterium]|nr:O-antigen ligase family protein [Bacillota bacterium]